MTHYDAQFCRNKKIVSQCPKMLKNPIKSRVPRWDIATAFDVPTCPNVPKIRVIWGGKDSPLASPVIFPL